MMETLLASLETDQTLLVDSWGRDTYDQVTEMVEVERASIDLRVETDDNRAARARQEVIK